MRKTLISSFTAAVIATAIVLSACRATGGAQVSATDLGASTAKIDPLVLKRLDQGNGTEVLVTTTEVRQDRFPVPSSSAARSASLAERQAADAAASAARREAVGPAKVAVRQRHPQLHWLKDWPELPTQLVFIESVAQARELADDPDVLRIALPKAVGLEVSSSTAGPTKSHN
jgi:hypothetical protein